MGLSNYKLGELLQFEDTRNYDKRYTLDDVRGISIQKVFIETKADIYVYGNNRKSEAFSWQ